MGNKDGTKNKDSCPRDEEKRRNSNSYSRRSRTTRFKSPNIRYQSKRANRTDCTGASNISFRDRANGGVVDQLIDEYRDQVDLKKCAIRKLEVEIEQLESRINDFEQIRISLNQTSQK